jgi:hypothetical protein
VEDLRAIMLRDCSAKSRDMAVNAKQAREINGKTGSHCKKPLKKS